MNGTPFLLRKEQTGGYSRLKKIDKQELVSRLKQLRELKHTGHSGTAVTNSIASMGGDLTDIATSSNAMESSQPTTATIPISSSALVPASPTNKVRFATLFRCTLIISLTGKSTIESTLTP